MKADPYVRLTKDIAPRRGFSVVDEANRAPHPVQGVKKIPPRTFEQDRHYKQYIKPMRRSSEELLAEGAAVGQDLLGLVRHCWPDADLRFCGFAEANRDGDFVTVRRRGSIVLTVEGLTVNAVGMDVYAHGPDLFTLEPGGQLVGKIKIIERLDKRRALVSFRAWDDSLPFDLNARRV